MRMLHKNVEEIQHYDNQRKHCPHALQEEGLLLCEMMSEVIEEERHEEDTRYGYIVPEWHARIDIESHKQRAGCPHHKGYEKPHE